MPFYAYEGLPGSGKSYGIVAKVLIPALIAGRMIDTNLPLVMEEILKVYPNADIKFLDEHSPAELIKQCRPGAVVIIDEIWRYWQFGTPLSKVPFEEIEFFKMHRHKVDEKDNAMQIYGISQSVDDIPKWMRQLVNMTFSISKMDNVGMDKWFRVDKYYKCPATDAARKKAHQGQEKGKYNPVFFKFYRSHTQHAKGTDGGAGIEKVIDKRGNGLKSAVVMRMILALTLGIPICVYATRHTFDKLAHPAGTTEPAKPAPSAVVYAAGPPPSMQPRPVATPISSAPAPTVAQAQPASAPTPAPASTPAVPPPPPLSTDWRIVGVIAGPNAPAGGYAYLRSSVRAMRRVSLRTCHKIDGSDDYSCLVDGITVTNWTGTASDFKPTAAQPTDYPVQPHPPSNKGGSVEAQADNPSTFNGAEAATS